MVVFSVENHSLDLQFQDWTLIKEETVTSRSCCVHCVHRKPKKNQGEITEVAAFYSKLFPFTNKITCGTLGFGVGNDGNLEMTIGLAFPGERGFWVCGWRWVGGFGAVTDAVVRPSFEICAVAAAATRRRRLLRPIVSTHPDEFLFSLELPLLAWLHLSSAQRRTLLENPLAHGNTLSPSPPNPEGGVGRPDLISDFGGKQNTKNFLPLLRLFLPPIVCLRPREEWLSAQTALTN